MNRRHHLLNAVLLGAALGVLLAPGGGRETALSVVAVAVPVVLGALVPDVDVVVGRHRKTLHNLPVLVGFAAFPLVFGNLRYVWIGVATHYALDLAGSRRGIALWYPLRSREFALPWGVAATDRSAVLVTLLVTAIEVVVLASVVGYSADAVVVEAALELVDG